MNWIKNLSISQKIYVLVGLAVLGVTTLGAIGISEQGKLSDRNEILGGTQLPAVRHATQAHAFHGALRSTVFQSMITSVDDMPDVLIEAKAFATGLSDQFAKLSAMDVSDEVRSQLAPIEDGLGDYIEACLESVQACTDDEKMTAFGLMPTIGESFEELETNFRAVSKAIIEGAEAAAAESRTVAASATQVLMMSILAAAIVAGAFGMFLARQIVRPLVSAVEVLESGDLSKLASVQSKDEIGRMAVAIQASVENLERSASELSEQKQTIEANAHAMELSAQEARANAQRAEELAAEAARVAAMVENSPTPMMFADDTQTLRYMNPAARETLARLGGRWAPENLADSSLDRFFEHPLGNDQFFPVEANLPFETQFEIGTETVEMSCSAIQDQQGTRTGTLVAWALVTERVQAERTSQELTLREVRQAQELSARIDRMLEAVASAAAGDLTVTIPEDGDDSIGQMASALTQFLAHLRGSIGRIRSSAETLGSAADNLRLTSERMSSEADSTAEQVTVVARAADQVATAMSTVTESTTGLDASIREIAHSAGTAATVARDAVATAVTTNSTVTELDRSTEEIGQILKTIQGIAGQTNLLALNATIEAARAGEMGKGFAVVANEVKNLARETALATTDIAQKIQAIQGGSRGAVEAIGQIGRVIGEIDSLQATIATAVEEQSAATKQIAMHLTDASGSSQEITANMGAVSGAARESSSGAHRSRDVALEVAAMADELRESVSQFRV